MTVKSPAHRALRLLTVAAVGAGSVLATAAPATAAVPEPVAFQSPGNPILGDGSFYSADAAPLVVGDTLYIYAGHDEAAPQQAGFEMHDYGVFSTEDVASGQWKLYQDDMDPGQVFSWATGNNAYAGQAVAGPDGRYYWYVPVQSEDTTVPNPMAIGVAVSDTPVGPWTDAIGKPLLTWTDVFGTSTNGQEVIDPAVFRDDDGTVYLHWGSWGVSRAVKLDAAMTSTVGTITTMVGLDGFYEAPWVFERNGTYYMAYDWKVGGSACTPSNYQACIAYATADNPLGPWTYRGIILGGTSATTVHPSIVEFKGRWYITYHTKDAVGGGHFRRSVAIDEVQWDGDTILPVTRTLADDPAFRLGRNVAPAAQVDASFTEQPPMRLGALNDGRALTALLPPDQWGNYRGKTSAVASDWVSYRWDAPVRVDGAGIQFHEDPNWIRPPADWRIEYLDAAGDWQPVTGASYPTSTTRWNELSFDPVTTTALRATFDGAPEGAAYHSVAVSEWEVYAATSQAPQPVSVATVPGTAPALPPAVRLSFAGADPVWAPVSWRPVDAGSYATAGSFTVEGRVLGYADAFLTATVTVDPAAVPPTVTDTTAPVTSISFSGSQGRDGWFSSPVTARVAADDDLSYLTDVSVRVGDGAWATTDGVRHVDVTVDTEGTTSVSGRAVDGAGNTAADVTKSVRIDRTAPTVAATVDGPSRTTTVTASDALSGLDGVQFRFDNTGDWQTVTDGTIAAPDALPHLVAVRATDLAGNAAVATGVIPLSEGVELSGNVAGYATPTASYTSGWESVNGLIDGTTAPWESDADKLGSQWGTWPVVGEQWAQLAWPFAVTVDRTAVWWYSDALDAANGGLIPPRSWKLQYLDADGATWRDVTPIAGTGYDRTRDTYVPVTFAPVTTRSLRVLAQAWGAAEGGGSVGIREWQVLAATDQGGGADTTAPTVTLAADPATPDGDADWYTRAVTVTATATDDTDLAPIVEADIDGAGWAVVSGPIPLSADGAHSVAVRATDAAGNTSAVTTWSAKVDATAPVSKAVWAATARTVTLVAADDTSSIARVEYAPGDGAWQEYAAPVVIGADEVTVRYRATDAAGNVEPVRRLEVPKSGVTPVRSTVRAVLSAASVPTGSVGTVAVAVTGGAATPATGTAQLLEGQTLLATGTLAGGVVALTTPLDLLPGTHRLTVRYSGDAVYGASSANVSLQVVKAASTTTVATAADQVYAAQPAATVTVTNAAGVPATGQVTLRVDGRKVATGTLSAGTAQLTVPVMATGAHTVSADYAGDTRLTASAASTAVTVTKAPTTIEVTPAAATVTATTRPTVTVRVTASPASVVPAGTVTVRVSGAGVDTVRSGRLVAGVVVVTLPTFAPGSYQVTAGFAGSSNLAESSASTSMTVTAR